MAKITYDPPKVIATSSFGDPETNLNVDELRVVALSFNRQKGYETTQGTAILSVTVEHPASGWVHTVIYQDAQALAYIKAINSANFSAIPLDQRLLEKLVADGKLPSGTIVTA